MLERSWDRGRVFRMEETKACFNCKAEEPEESEHSNESEWGEGRWRQQTILLPTDCWAHTGLQQFDLAFPLAGDRARPSVQ